MSDTTRKTVPIRRINGRPLPRRSRRIGDLVKDTTIFEGFDGLETRLTYAFGHLGSATNVGTFLSMRGQTALVK